MTPNHHSTNQQTNSSPSTDCQITTQHDSDVCFVSLDVISSTTTERTRNTLRFHGPAEAAQFLERLASEATKAKAELERSGTPSRQFVGLGMPAALNMEAGRDESGYFVIVHINNDQEETVRRDITFRTKADAIRFLSEAEDAVPSAIEMIENAERNQEANDGVS